MARVQPSAVVFCFLGLVFLSLGAYLRWGKKKRGLFYDKFAFGVGAACIVVGGMLQGFEFDETMRLY